MQPGWGKDSSCSKGQRNFLSYSGAVVKLPQGRKIQSAWGYPKFTTHNYWALDSSRPTWNLCRSHLKRDSQVCKNAAGYICLSSQTEKYQHLPRAKYPKPLCSESSEPVWLAWSSCCLCPSVLEADCDPRPRLTLPNPLHLSNVLLWGSFKWRLLTKSFCTLINSRVIDEGNQYQWALRISPMLPTVGQCRIKAKLLLSSLSLELSLAPLFKAFDN